MRDAQGIAADRGELRGIHAPWLEAEARAAAARLVVVAARWYTFSKKKSRLYSGFTLYMH